MYLNALLLDFPLAPKVPADLRRRPRNLRGRFDPRRAARERELDLAGRTPAVRSGRETSATNRRRLLRPDRSELDAAIARRSRKIVRDGLGEARVLNDMLARGENEAPRSWTP